MATKFLGVEIKPILGESVVEDLVFVYLLVASLNGNKTDAQQNQKIKALEEEIKKLKGG